MQISEGEQEKQDCDRNNTKNKIQGNNDKNNIIDTEREKNKERQRKEVKRKTEKIRNPGQTRCAEMLLLRCRHKIF